MADPRRFTIQPVGFHPAVTTAAQELAKYLPRLAPVSARPLAPLSALPRGSDALIVLGTSDSLAGIGLGDLPPAHDLDDGLAILPRAGNLFLVGSNPRSVLFAAYRLLEELGAVFLRPGPGGEVLPRRGTLPLPRRPIREQASYRHRGICIEGAPRLEHVLGLLDWMAKKKMNAFQLQFRHAGTFWRRGYASPEMDPPARAARLSDEDCIALDDRVIARMKELGMVLHRVGHGWTAAALGYEGVSWEKEAARELPEGQRDWPALVAGRRGIWHGEPVNTELCYSSPEVRRAFIESVMAYARRHSEVDALHVWLSDDRNNRCECSSCATKSASDWYALLVGELGERMRADGLTMRVVFLAYCDLLWPPESVRPASDNLILMYAPITRCYRHRLGDARCDDGASWDRPALNRYELSSRNRAHAEIARMWRGRAVRDSFLFDYHLWSTGAVWRDGLGQDVGAVMAQDVKELGSLGLDGLMSCQCVRAFYPLPYLPNVMADMLWDTSTPVAPHRKKIMSAAFGAHAQEAEDYFSRMVRGFRVGSEYDHRTILEGGGAAHRERLKRMGAVATEARRGFGSLAKQASGQVSRLSLRLLAVHAEQVEVIVRAHLAALDGDGKSIARLRARHDARVPRILRAFSPWIDPMFAAPAREALAAAERAVR